MSRLARFLRDRASEEVGRLGPSDRIQYALRLGDDDADLLASATGSSREQAVDRITRSRQLGRRPSASATSGDDAP